MRSSPTSIAIFASVALSASSTAQVFEPPSYRPPRPGNVLLIVGDDLGCDMLGSFGQHPAAPPTPTLDMLAANGVSFVSTYTDPICSPSRAAMLTGRYGVRTGMGMPIEPSLPEFALPQVEVTLPERLQELAPWPVAASAIGKWHLNSALDGPTSPNHQGFEFYQGTEGNLSFGQSYTSYVKVLNGVYGQASQYATSDQVDDALKRIGTMPEPWFLYLGFNASHKPFHAPPASLHSYPLAGPPSASPELHYRAAVQAMDTELGRLLASIDPIVLARTTIVFIGDNGSPNEAILPPTVAGKNKGTLYEGGVHVPLIISGHRVEQPGSRCYELVNSVDLFPTVLELFGADSTSPLPSSKRIDGISLMPYLDQPLHPALRDWVFASRFTPNGFGPYTSLGYMLRTLRWKLIYRLGQGELFFDMASAQGESHDLLSGPLTAEELAAFGYMKQQLATIVGP